MKTICDFCKTEYNITAPISGPVKCALCGHVWNITARPRRSSLLVFIAALCALLSAIVFSVVVVTHHSARTASVSPLVATLGGVETIIDDNGVPHFAVHGTVVNNSDEIYGVPDLIIVSRDAAGNPIAAQKFMPSATLLDAGASVEFSHTLTAPVAGVKKITVELDIIGTDDEKN